MTASSWRGRRGRTCAGIGEGDEEGSDVDTAGIATTAATAASTELDLEFIFMNIAVVAEPIPAAPAICKCCLLRCMVRGRGKRESGPRCLYELGLELRPAPLPDDGGPNLCGGIPWDMLHDKCRYVIIGGSSKFGTRRFPGAFRATTPVTFAAEARGLVWNLAGDGGSTAVEQAWDLRL